MLRIPHLLLLSPCWISQFSIVPELLCQLRFGFLGTAFGKAICHTLLYVCLFAVCARPDLGQSPRASAGQLLHSSCDGTYNFLYVCALCAYDMCDTLVLKFIMWPRQTRKQDNTTGQSRAEQNRATCNAITDIEIPMSAVTNSQTHTHTHTSNADNTSRYWVSEKERERESVWVSSGCVVYGWQHWRLCRVRAWHLEKRKHRDIFLNDAIWVDIFKVGERASDAHSVCCGL